MCKISCLNIKKVFREWEKLNIIERVPENEMSNKRHYLPHRSIIRIIKNSELCDYKAFRRKWSKFAQEEIRP